MSRIRCRSYKFRYVIIGGAVAGAGWYLFRLARGPDGQIFDLLRIAFLSDSQVAVIWSKTNPTPWNTVQADENIKLLSGHHKFEKR